VRRRVVDLGIIHTDVVGNLITLDDQKRKLEIVGEIARQVWNQIGLKVCHDQYLRCRT
jgi:hypothetical protein